ncbi:hypothetical protein S7711_10328 [Stachybotrys chartarum IBT 7711]|uniref:Uncharacterized protein n=1 Tax=Stachybotrys chartarum (strain CBS 109288 / IBT 7711) TaxID=1280523 RepID=A0A084AXS5_STACB|nr:hypothetical protein S7711_10328 [Stachybotrys chartarum IBT 7711]
MPTPEGKARNSYAAYATSLLLQGPRGL